MTEPKLTEADVRREFAATGAEPVIRFLRERGLIAEEPDKREAAYQAFLDRLEPGGAGFDMKFIFCAGYDAAVQDMELGRSDCSEALAPRKELTREIVREIVKVALHESGAVVEYDDFLPGSPVGPAREADDFVARLHTAIQEALQ